METSNPLNVLMNAANAPAQVMPERIEPSGAYFVFRMRGSSRTILSVPFAPMPL
jgi:hypothetical protein